MIDPYLLMAAGIFILVWLLPQIGGHDSARDFVIGKANYGLNAGTALLVAHMATVGVLFGVYFFTQRYGLIGGLLFIISLFFIMILYFRLLKTGELGSVFKLQNKKAQQWMMIVILVIAAVGSLIFQTILTAGILNEVTGVDRTITMPVFLYFCFVIAGLGGMRGMVKNSRLFVFLIFLMLMAGVLFLYLHTGIQTVYEDLKLMNPQMLKLPPGRFWSVWLTALFASGGFLLTDISFRDAIRAVQNRRKLQVERISIAVWLGFPLGALLVFIYIFTLYNGSLLIIPRPSGMLFFLVLVVSCVLGVSANIKSLMTVFLHMNKWEGSKKLLRNYQIGLIFFGIISLILPWTTSEFMSLWPLYVIFLVSICLPFGFVTAGRGYFLTLSIIGLTAGFTAYFLGLPVTVAVLLAAASQCVMMLLVFFIERFFKKDKFLQK